MKTPCAPDGEADCVSSLVVVGRWGRGERGVRRGEWGVGREQEQEQEQEQEARARAQDRPPAKGRVPSRTAPASPAMSQ